MIAPGNSLLALAIVVGLLIFASGITGMAGHLAANDLNPGGAFTFGNTSIGTYMDTNDANEQSVSYLPAQIREQ